MKKLTPNFFRAAANVTVGLLITSVLGYFSQGLNENHWWSYDYMLSLFLPFALMILATWFMFVPRCLEYDEREFFIHFWFRGRRKRSWEELRHYGGAFNVFLLQFGSAQAFQIFNGAYSKSDWLEFKTFLVERFPDRKASGWLGPFGFKWGKKKAE